LDDFEFHCLQDASKALLPLVWLLASESENGSVPPTQEIAYRLRKTVQQIEQALKPLIDKGFIIKPVSDSTVLATRKHLAMPEVETEVETEKEKDICVRGNPTLEEVVAYCKERKNQVDPDKWFDFYQSKGWYVGKNKMRDWRAAVRTWERNGYGGPFNDGQAQARDAKNWPGKSERRVNANRSAILAGLGISAEVRRNQPDIQDGDVAGGNQSMEKLLP
jgi:hypothetical protein